MGIRRMDKLYLRPQGLVPMVYEVLSRAEMRRRRKTDWTVEEMCWRKGEVEKGFAEKVFGERD